MIFNGGSSGSKPFHPSTNQQTNKPNQKVDCFCLFVELVDWIPLIIITVITWLLFISISLCYKVGFTVIILFYFFNNGMEFYFYFDEVGMESN